MTQDTDLIAQAFRIANAAVITDIETTAARVNGGTGRWYDIRPMLDPREQCSEFIDMNSQAIAYALAVGLVTADPTHAHLVRINERPE